MKKLFSTSFLIGWLSSSAETTRFIKNLVLKPLYIRENFLMTICLRTIKSELFTKIFLWSNLFEKCISSMLNIKYWRRFEFWDTTEHELDGRWRPYGVLSNLHQIAFLFTPFAHLILSLWETNKKNVRFLSDNAWEDFKVFLCYNVTSKNVWHIDFVILCRSK